MNEAAEAAPAFVVPALTGPATGGTLYNRELCAALAEASQPLAICSLDSPELEATLSATRCAWVDSLYLAAVPELKRMSAARLGLIAHYLPSFVAFGRAVQAQELSLEERRALSAADLFLVTSQYMREALARLVSPEKPILVVPPGSRAQLAAQAPLPSRGVRALLIGNVTRGKGIEPLLRALSEALQPSHRFELCVIGSLVADPAYAERCRRLIASAPALTERVSLRGSLAPEQTLAVLAGSELLVSASRMESYGMALAEARVVGVPILTCSGGNAVQHVCPRAGGRLVHSVEQLAAACVELAREPQRLRQRVARARARAPLARTWSGAAREFLDQLNELE